MTPYQRELARHALGLPNDRRRSYRNYFTAGPGHTDYEEWQSMVRLGYAKRRDGKTLALGGDDLFWLTEKSARGVLEAKEHLDFEDFPDEARAE